MCDVREKLSHPLQPPHIILAQIFLYRCEVFTVSSGTTLIIRTPHIDISGLDLSCKVALPGFKLSFYLLTFWSFLPMPSKSRPCSTTRYDRRCLLHALCTHSWSQTQMDRYQQVHVRTCMFVCSLFCRATAEVTSGSSVHSIDLVPPMTQSFIHLPWRGCRETR